MVNSKSNPDIVQELEEMSIVLLPINHSHISNYHRIPIISDHKDSFDRLLIATALTEELDIITVDEKFHYYKNQVKIIW
ncbi:PIN domain-containing protein [Dyadobacter sp. NIV53]|uniref:PIN domain-containing protein n=1 Tax=Dyadobacter sp. NIV53 TaxID=2861765 RepID=UPI001C8849CB|nr:PIN domain-containing protein [Dyadobacter sp. NIV53]